MVTTVRTEQDVKQIVERELQQISVAQLKEGVRGLSATMITLGVLQMIFGLFAASLPLVTGAFFVALLGAVLLATGALQIVRSITQKSWGRLALGIMSIAAGALTIAHPVFGLAFLTLLLGIYLVASGIYEMTSSGGNGWMVAGGILGVILGIIILAGLPASSSVALGAIVGAYVLIDGIVTVMMGMEIRRALVVRTQQ